jgi:hypothetical protein
MRKWVKLLKEKRKAYDDYIKYISIAKGKHSTLNKYC